MHLGDLIVAEIEVLEWLEMEDFLDFGEFVVGEVDELDMVGGQNRRGYPPDKVVRVGEAC